MKYFDDLELIRGAFVPNSQVVVQNRLYEDYYGIQFVLSGEICVHVEGREPWQDNGPLVFFTSPGKRFTHYTPHGTRAHMFLCFRGPRVQRYIEGGLFPVETGIKIPVSTPKELHNLFTHLLSLLRKKDFTSQGEMVLGLEKLLLQISMQSNVKQKNETYRGFIKEIGEKIAASPGEEWNFSEIARKHHLSGSYFRRLFTDEIGVSPWKFVLNCRVHYACQLLESTPFLLKEISHECGFTSPFNFSRQFRQIMKVSPEEYRKHNNNKDER